MLPRWRTLYQAIAAIIIMTAAAPLWAISTHNELTDYLGERAASNGNDAVLFQTKDCTILTLADEEGNIGAALLHSKNKKTGVKETVEQLSSLLSIGEAPMIRYSRDGFSAIMLYEEVAQQAQQQNDALVAISRLVCVYNICNTDQGNCTPHRWHNGGISFRSYNHNTLRYEITPDLTRAVVPYVEIRIAKHISDKAVPMLAAHDYGLPANKQTLRLLASSLGGAAPISSNSANDTHLARRKDVFCLGYKSNLHSANRARENTGHYIFPSFNLPQQDATLNREADAPITSSTKIQINDNQVTMKGLRAYMSGGTKVDENLHIYQIDGCKVTALAEANGKLGAFIIEAIAPAETDKVSTLRSKLLNLFPTPLYNYRNRNGECEVILFHGKQPKESLLNADRMEVFRTLILNNRGLTNLCSDGQYFKLTYPTREAGNQFTIYFDSTLENTNILTVRANKLSVASNSDIIPLLRLPQSDSVDDEDRERMAQALYGDLRYVHKKSKVVVTSTNSTSANPNTLYAAGSAKIIRKINQEDTLTPTPISKTSLPEPTTLPTSRFDAASPTPPSETDAANGGKENTSYSPEEARKAYIEYLKNI